MKKVYLYVSVSAGSFILGFLIFYFLMPVIVSHGKVIEVPYLKHMNVKEGMNFLRSLRLKPVISDSVYSQKIEKGKIVRTEPEEKVDVKLGSKVKIIVSKGGKKVKLPDVVGLKKEQAEDSLDVYGIVNRVIINIPVKDKDKDGIVIRTKPEARDSLEKGTKFTLFIGKEKRKVFLMPNLIGLTLDEATDIINEYELVLAPVKWTKSSKEEVLIQSPLAGVEVTFGDTVKLVVGRK